MLILLLLLLLLSCLQLMTLLGGTLQEWLSLGLNPGHFEESRFVGTTLDDVRMTGHELARPQDPILPRTSTSLLQPFLPYTDGELLRLQIHGHLILLRC